MLDLILRRIQQGKVETRAANSQLLARNNDMTQQLAVQLTKSSRAKLFRGFLSSIYKFASILLRISHTCATCGVASSFQHTHTLAQKHIIELLRWNALHVQKHLSKPDRNGWMIRSEKMCKGNLSTSLLEGLTCSDAARSSSSDICDSDCENRAKRDIGNQVV